MVGCSRLLALALMLGAAQSAAADEPDSDDPIVAADQMFARRAEALEAAAVQDLEHADEQLYEAAQIRLGLGQPAAAEADLAARERRHRGDPARVAELFWSRRELLRSDDERLAHAELYLRRHARAGARDRRIVAEVTVGTISWDRSCDKQGVFGCLVILWRRASGHLGRERPRPLKLKTKGPVIAAKYRRIPGWCEPGARGAVIVYWRDEALAARAQAHLARALQLARAVDIPAEDPARRSEYEEALAVARMVRADPALHEFLAREAPRGLRFWPDPWLLESGTAADARTHARQLLEVGPSRRRHDAFMRAVADEAAALRQGYAQLTRDEAAARLPGLFARAALVENHYTRLVAGVAPPAGAASKQVVAEFCAEQQRVAHANDAAQEQLWDRCVATSVEHGDDGTREGCEAVLAEQWPARYPVNAELFAPIDATPAWLVHLGVQTEVPVHEPR